MAFKPENKPETGLLIALVFMVAIITIVVVGGIGLVIHAFFC